MNELNLRYVVIQNLMGFVIFDTIDKKTVSLRYDTRELAKEELERMIEQEVLTQIEYRRESWIGF